MKQWLNETWQEVKRQWNKPKKRSEFNLSEYILVLAIIILLFGRWDG